MSRTVSFVFIGLTAWLILSFALSGATLFATNLHQEDYGGSTFFLPSGGTGSGYDTFSRLLLDPAPPPENSTRGWGILSFMAGPGVCRFASLFGSLMSVATFNYAILDAFGEGGWGGYVPALFNLAGGLLSILLLIGMGAVFLDRVMSAPTLMWVLIGGTAALSLVARLGSSTGVLGC